MTHIALKPFNTRQRRIAAGTILPASEDLAPHSRQSLTANKFIALEPVDVPQPAKPARRTSAT